MEHTKRCTKVKQLHEACIRAGLGCELKKQNDTKRWGDCSISLNVKKSGNNLYYEQ